MFDHQQSLLLEEEQAVKCGLHQVVRNVQIYVEIVVWLSFGKLALVLFFEWNFLVVKADV